LADEDKKETAILQTHLKLSAIHNRDKK